MASIPINQVGRGQAIRYNNELFIIIGMEHVKPGKGPAYQQTKMKNIESGKIIEVRFRSEDKLDVIRNVRTLIAELPELAQVYRDALKIADTYPDSLGARILRESLNIGEPEAILNTEQTLRKLQEWLIRKSDPC